MRQVSAYEPMYLLPAYYTFAPDSAVYGNTLPDDQRLRRLELKFQLSFKIALMPSGPAKSVYVAYTQSAYWQCYGETAFFRETNYQPELLVAPETRWDLGAGWKLGVRLSPIMHQSNGRGGGLERSWNRTSGDLLFERLDPGGDGWTAGLRAWGVWRGAAYRRYNRDLARYLGHTSVSAGYRRGPWELSLASRNQIESGFRRGSVEMSASHYLGDNWSVYAQYFNGYGQSLIEYNHATNALGAGVALRTR